MNHLYIKRSTVFGIVACLISSICTLPIFRYMLFRDSNSSSILERVSPESFAFTGDIVNVLATLTLIIPYFIDVYIFRQFTIANYSVVALALNVIIIMWFFSNCYNIPTFLLKIFLVMPASLMIFGSGNKEIYSVIALVIFMLQFDARNGSPKKVGVSVRPIFIYALFFRPYYVVLAICLKLGRPFLIGSLLLLLFLTSVYIDQLSPVLDGIINRRSLPQSYLANSAVEQVFIVTDIRSFFYHIIDSLVLTCIPLLGDMSLKNLFLQIYIVVTITLAAISDFYIVKAIFVLWIFFILMDPDLGTFLRHIGALFPLFKGVRFT